MHDPIPEMWADRMARLPRVEELVFTIAPNPDRECVTCIICNRGEDDPPEWLVFMRARGTFVTLGLHEVCRERHARWTAARATQERKGGEGG